MWGEITYPFLNFNGATVINLTLYWACDYLFMVGLKLNRVSKREPWAWRHILHTQWPFVSLLGEPPVSHLHKGPVILSKNFPLCGIWFIKKIGKGISQLGWRFFILDCPLSLKNTRLSRVYQIFILQQTTLTKLTRDQIGQHFADLNFK